MQDLHHQPLHPEGVQDPGFIVNPRKLEHRFRMIYAGIPFTLL